MKIYQICLHDAGAHGQDWCVITESGVVLGNYHAATRAEGIEKTGPNGLFTWPRNAEAVVIAKGKGLPDEVMEANKGFYDPDSLPDPGQ